MEIGGWKKEKDFQASVIKVAKTFGWAYYHTYDSRMSVAGWPDLVLCRPPCLIFVELKMEKKYPTKAQRHWGGLLKQCNAEYYLWRPKNWDDVIARLSRPS